MNSAANLKTWSVYSIKNKEILFTIGHLVKRKDVAWFVANVIPRLENSYLYVVAGEGPERRTVQRIVDQYDLQDHVLLLGEVSDEDRKLIYNASDIFIMLTSPFRVMWRGSGLLLSRREAVAFPWLQAIFRE